MRRMAEVEKQPAPPARRASRRSTPCATTSIAARSPSKIAAFIKQINGLLRYEDMAAFRLKPEEAASTSYHGYEVYKPGFWSQGPAMLEALNMLEGSDLRALKLNSTEYLHRLVEAMKLAYADRDTYYGDPKFASVPAERLLSKEYAEERRALIGTRGSFDFRPGKIDGAARDASLRSRDGADSDRRCARGRAIRPAWTPSIRMASCFRSTPSGAWLPSVICRRDRHSADAARAEFSAGAGPSERTRRRQAAAGHAESDAGYARRQAVSCALHAGRRQPGPVAAADDARRRRVRHDPQEAVEAPRFQTRHLVSSFDNHAMSPGDLLLDERIAASVVAELAARGHKVQQRSKWASGAAPVMIRMRANGVIEAGADPYGQRAAAAW